MLPTSLHAQKNVNSLLNEAFQLKKSSDDDFANNWYAQLEYIYQHSDYYENAHLQYPVYRVMNDFEIKPD